MVKNRRAEKGEVALWVRGEKLWLRWRFGRQQHQLSLGLDDSPYNRFKAQEVSKQIKTDIAYGHFDPADLKRYKPILRSADLEIDLNPPKPTTVSQFEAFINHRQSEGTSGQAIASRYKPLLANLKRFERDIEDEDLARKFVDVLRSRQSPRIANQNLTLLKSFADWAIPSGQREANLFASIKPLKVDKSQSRDKPFTQDEIVRFLATIKTDRYYHCYHDLCMTLFYLGLRPSEAIGLRWKHVDFTRRQVTICESLSRSPEGNTAGYARQRKGVKTSDGQRILDLRDKLYEMLLGRKPVDANPEGLIFLSPTNRAINDHNFSQRVWRGICKKAKIDYRPPYCARHSLLSHLIESGATLPQTAYVAGHRDTRMVAETYGHMINRPKMIDF
ncbi:MAG: site-specific integrase [Aphanocapsa sp. GSE-SYN-MK-11-07L]|jgi:integrase|nr:site-specific integrase [Aphanocapsa sp. GSE-SYN-MK-11-07L]